VQTVLDATNNHHPHRPSISCILSFDDDLTREPQQRSTNRSGFCKFEPNKRKVLPNKRSSNVRALKHYLTYWFFFIFFGKLFIVDDLD
jgi:hypothetical protein